MVAQATNPPPPSFFADFWQVLVELGHSSGRTEIREKLKSAYETLISLITRLFLTGKMPKYCDIEGEKNETTANLRKFGEKYFWELNLSESTPPIAKNVVTPPILDLVLQDYVKITQGIHFSTIESLENLPALEQSTKKNGKKFVGLFFTPPILAKILAQRVISNYLLSQEHGGASSLTVLDPSVGSGVFLVAAADILLQELQNTSPHLNRFDLIGKILSHHLYGIDILPEALCTTYARLSLWAASHVKPEARESFIQQLEFREHLLCADTLTMPVESLALSFHQRSFPVVIGNPPFLHTRTGLIDARYKKQLKSLFSDVAIGQWDLCTLFIRRIGDLLSPTGHWGLVLPSRLLSNEHYFPIRKWILDHYDIHTIQDAGMAFADAGVEVITLVVGPKVPIPASFSFEMFDGNSSKRIGEMHPSQLSKFPFSAIPWLPEDAFRKLVLKISDISSHLSDYVTITRGFECGFNDAAIGSADQLTQGGYDQASLIPVIKGTNIDKFHVELAHPRVFARPDWKNPSKFKTPELFQVVPKIVARFVANDIIAAMDESGYANTNGVYNIHPRPPYTHDDLWWILALLNSAPVSFWFMSVFANRDKLYPHIQKNQLEAIPFPHLTLQNLQVLVYLSKSLQRCNSVSQRQTIQVRCLDPLATTLYFQDGRTRDFLIILEKAFHNLEEPQDLLVQLNQNPDFLFIYTELKNRYFQIFK